MFSNISASLLAINKCKPISKVASWWVIKVDLCIIYSEIAHFLLTKHGINIRGYLAVHSI